MGYVTDICTKQFNSDEKFSQRRLAVQPSPGSCCTTCDWRSGAAHPLACRGIIDKVEFVEYTQLSNQKDTHSGHQLEVKNTSAYNFCTSEKFGGFSEQVEHLMINNTDLKYKH